MTSWLNQTATYNYDDAGRLISLTNFNGTVTTYTLDDADRLTGSSGDSLPISPVREANKVWRYGYDSGHRITSLKNPLNTTTATNTYNSQGQVIHQVGK